MDTYRVVAESMIHRGRRLLMNEQGDGFIQINDEALPLPLDRRDFARFMKMRHYRPTPEAQSMTSRSEPLAIAV